MLQEVSVLGGPPSTIVDAPNLVVGASWGTDDQIIFGTMDEGLFRVPALGGSIEALTTPASDQGETGHESPFIIPNYQAALFVVRTGSAIASAQLAALDLNTGQVSRLGLAGIYPHYVVTGHLVYAAEDGSLRAAPFDPDRLAVTGEPVILIESVMVKDSGSANFSVSHTGRLVYMDGRVGGGKQRALVWVDRAGGEEAIPAPLRSYRNARLSGDGLQAALDIRSGDNDIWVWDFVSARLTRLTYHSAADIYGHWTPDGQRVVFTSQRDGRREGPPTVRDRRRESQTVGLGTESTQ